VRRLLLLLTLLLAGCQLAAESADVGGGDDDSGVAPECATAIDCVLASSTCCGCGEYAMPDFGQDSCEDVECGEPEPGACPAVAAACLDGACVAACVEIACPLTCEAGFAVDAAGCLTCACAPAADPMASCSIDEDCVAVPADCCGCARGGSDTAVPANDADAFGEALACDSNAACPEVDVCDSMVAPRCVSGQCQLGDGLPPLDAADPCGRPDLPVCPDGTVCVLNADPAASSQGLGTCR